MDMRMDMQFKIGLHGPDLPSARVKICESIRRGTVAVEGKERSECVRTWYGDLWFKMARCSYDLFSYGLRSYGLCVYGLYSYGLLSHGL